MSQSPLVIRFGAIGDLIVTTPLLRALSKKYDSPCDVVARGAWPHQIFAELPFVREIKTVRNRKLPFWLSREQRDLVRWLKHRGPGPVFLLENDEQSHRLLSKSGLHAMASCRDMPRNLDEHVVDYFARLAQFSPGDPYYARHFELNVTEDEKKVCRQWLQKQKLEGNPLILVQAGNRKSSRWTRQTDKDWPQDRWVALMRNILDSLPDCRILLCGTSKEERLTLGMQSAVRDARVCSVAGELDLRMLFALLTMSHSMVSVDTGPAHAAAALDCPLVVLFGETDPRDISPVSRTAPVKILTGPPGAPEPPGKHEWSKHHFMEGISVDLVTTAWQDLYQHR